MAGLAGAAIGAVATISASNDAKHAGQDQANAAARLSELQMAQQRPWTEAGTWALGQLTSGYQPGGQYTKPFTMGGSEIEKHVLEQGTRAIENSAAARGGLLSTNTLQNLTEFGQANAAKYETDAFNQWLAQRNAQVNPLFSIAGLGQQVQSQLSSDQVNLGLAGASARAAGDVASGNIIRQGVGDQITMLSNLFGNSGGGQTWNPYTQPGSNGSYANPTGGGMGIDNSGYLGGPSTAGDYSDERLKKDIKRVGYTDDGLPIYTYRMKGGPDGNFKMGVMAHDVEESNPRAVTKDHRGFRMVDYGKI